MLNEWTESFFLGWVEPMIGGVSRGCDCPEFEEVPASVVVGMSVMYLFFHVR